MDTKIAALLLGQIGLASWHNLESSSALKDGGGADTGGPNKLAHGTHEYTVVPDVGGTLNFHPAKRPAGQPWDNLYMFGILKMADSPLQYISWGLDFVLMPSDIHGNAREFEAELCEGGFTYNMAWQYKWSTVDGPPAWRLFDQVGGHWKPPGISKLPTPTPTPGKIVSIKALFSIDRSAGKTTHEAIMIDGTMFTIGESHPRKQKWSPTTNYLHHAVQIDSLGDGQPCSIGLKNWNIMGL